MIRACMGGTFDILHMGHKSLLERASSAATQVVVGLTTDERAKKNRKTATLNSYEIRKRNLRNFLQEMGVLDKFTIVPLSDDWGPSVLEDDFDVIVVSQETKINADKINLIRMEDGKKELDIIVVPMMYADDGSIISSSRIRNSEIDSSGNLT